LNPFIRWGTEWADEREAIPSTSGVSLAEACPA
jgi:hypothetical protein